MILFDRKKALNQIMGPSPKDKEEEGKIDPAHVMAKEAIDAVHNKDHEGFANAARALYMHFGSEGNASEDHEEE